MHIAAARAGILTWHREANLAPSMMDAWFSSSEKMLTAASLHRAETAATLAAKPVGNNRQSSVPLSSASRLSSSSCRNVYPPTTAEDLGPAVKTLSGTKHSASYALRNDSRVPFLGSHPQHPHFTVKSILRDQLLCIAVFARRTHAMSEHCICCRPGNSGMG